MSSFLTTSTSERCERFPLVGQRRSTYYHPRPFPLQGSKGALGEVVRLGLLLLRGLDGGHLLQFVSDKASSGC